ncbi:hypothetical protein UFOVP1470_20 [uncultured Caudovirales phage]|uniref:Uncharacterized protein n=1 Tax=uncultured Caudovirales phage TaxID=2100421 RepID=A0A6J5PN87_9CAUD|nr:hypothetical protein UFOVP939_6 [uncultured Caudovirales phage]CAB4178562.1 hypothetical protein UFOVP1018_18 [uncultured Caudovirales phage]CAB4183949.1 hypothetical protein UFOVP1105_19 [uncultured Caudovirales phage]CAB4202372.1 hypothetical protein UFOVP1372_9 [uncultured Caudovirales phage]CAB4215001.1 hypothetical protein UFOVP1470_20 [uncultured Caudovirales phage]
MELQPIPYTNIDRAWSDGASCLSEACDKSGGEITGSQLKMILSRSERTLLRMWDGEAVRGWGVVRVDQLPNLRVLFVTDLVAHNGGFQQFFDAIKQLARDLGCSKIRCAAGVAQERLYRSKCGFKPVYNILEVDSL